MTRLEMSSLEIIRLEMSYKIRNVKFGNDGATAVWNGPSRPPYHIETLLVVTSRILAGDEGDVCF
jgi:hypothetical protein